MNPLIIAAKGEILCRNGYDAADVIDMTLNEINEAYELVLSRGGINV